MLVLVLVLLPETGGALGIRLNSGNRRASNVVCCSSPSGQGSCTYLRGLVPSPACAGQPGRAALGRRLGEEDGRGREVKVARASPAQVRPDRGREHTDGCASGERRPRAGPPGRPAAQAQQALATSASRRGVCDCDCGLGCAGHGSKF
ncbi:unnamed protein product, partial [Prorocentrum cordatum]